MLRIKSDNHRLDLALHGDDIQRGDDDAEFGRDPPSDSGGNGSPGESQPTTQQPAILQPARVRAAEHGEGDRVRPGGHGDKLWTEVQHLLPDLVTQGFVLIGGNAVKVWVALLIHALAHGAVAAENDDRLHSLSSRSSARKPKKPATTKPKIARKSKPNPKTKVTAHPRHEAAAKTVRVEGEWDNGSLMRATNLKNTAVHAAQNELTILGWLNKQSIRTLQGQFGGFRYVLQKPPAELTDAAKKHYGKKLNAIFGRAYDLQHILESTNVETVGGDCPTHAELFALAAGKVSDGDGKKMVIDGHLRGCAKCRDRLKDILVSEQEWGK
jgi:hypothetical protein